MNGMIRRWGFGAVVAGGLLFAGASSASAQGGDGFLFKEPVVTVKFESGYGFQRAQAPLFDFVIEQQTIGRRDFDSPYFGGEIGVRLSERLDLALSVGYQQSSTFSEYWDYIGTDDLPIEQLTELRQIPAVATLKYYPFARGRSLGRFAWIPRTFTPFIGGGAGVVSYRFEQSGEFVDEETLDIFNQVYVTDGEGFLARATAGFDVSLSSQFLFTVEGRYSWASAEVGGQYSHEDFGNIDLNGLQVVGGIAIRF